MSKDIRVGEDNPQNGIHFANHISNKRLDLAYVKNSYSSIIKRQIIQFKNGQRISIDISPE